MNRRGFLSAILATACAPAIVRAESLMRCSGIVVPTVFEVVRYGGPARLGGTGLITIEQITREMLAIFREKLSNWPVGPECSIQDETDGWKRGDHLFVRRRTPNSIIAESMR